MKYADHIELMMSRLSFDGEPVAAEVGAVVVAHRAHEQCHYCEAGNAHDATHCAECGCPLAKPLESQPGETTPAEEP